MCLKNGLCVPLCPLVGSLCHCISLSRVQRPPGKYVLVHQILVSNNWRNNDKIKTYRFGARTSMNGFVSSSNK